MEQLKRIGALGRQHYEKVILVLVLVLMAVAVWVIFEQSQEERDKISKIPVGFDRRAVKGVKPVDLAPIEKSLKAATNPPSLNLGGSHNLFSPVLWVQYPGKPWTKVETGTEVGVAKLQITAIRPLALSIAYDRPAISGAGDQKVVTGYHTVVTNDLTTVAARRRLSQFMVMNDTNKQVFVLVEAKGPAETPTELVARLKEFGNETVSFAPGKPYVRVIGYEVDLKYAVTGVDFKARRKDSTVVLEGETYKIVDITDSAVVLSDNSNGKRYTIEQTTPQ
jgi:hypothetical protein